MGIFSKKKKEKALSESDLDDSNIIDFNEFEEFEDELKKKETIDPKEVAKHFIFTIDNGCPICGSDVRGNDFFKYFCDSCNLLFDKKDIIEREFGQSITDTQPGPVHKTVLTDEERDALARKRKELNERIYKTFSAEQRQELFDEAEELRDENTAESDADKEDEPVEEQEPEEIAEVIDEEPEDDSEEEQGSSRRDKILEAEYEDVAEDTEAQEETDRSEEATPEEDIEDDQDDDDDEHGSSDEDDEEPTPEQEEYDLEDEGKIIASSGSNKLHKGDCHFVKKIHPENRIYFDTIKQGEDEDYELCVCLRRLKAMKR